MGLGGYLTWTAAAREIRKITGDNIKMLPVEQHGNFLKLIKSPIFYNNPDFFMSSGKEYVADEMVLPLILNNPNANYCKQDTPDKAFHRHDKHIIEQICECYGIQNPELKCVIHLNDEEKSFANDFHQCILKGEKYITIEPFSKDNYTPNRKYPFEKWQKAVDSLCDKIKIVQVGNSGKVLNNVENLTGDTSFREAVAVIERSALFLASESGLVHASTAVNTKSVVVITGYQDEKMVEYPQNININIANHGPCGLKIECSECEKDAKEHNWLDIVTIVEKELVL